MERGIINNNLFHNIFIILNIDDKIFTLNKKFIIFYTVKLYKYYIYNNYSYICIN